MNRCDVSAEWCCLFGADGITTDRPGVADQLRDAV